MADNTAAYKKLKGEVPEQPSQDDELKKLYMSYMTTPTDMSKLQNPENVVSQTISGVKEAKGVVPKILQGLGGVMRFATTGTGETILSQALGGDRFSKEAWLNSAQAQKERETAEKQGAMAQDSKRLEAVGKYTADQQKLFEDRKNKIAEGLVRYGDLEGAKAITELSTPEELSQWEISNPEKKSVLEEIFSGLTGINIGGGQKLASKKGNNVMTATGADGSKIQSNDGGKTWQPIPVK